VRARLEESFYLLPSTLNSIYITLILKKDKPDTFIDYRPIFLCNLMYKIITKIIADRMKPILRRYISEDRFGFLLNRQVLDAVGIAQECLHSIKMKKQNAFILKKDLIKSYDRVD